MNMGVRHHPDHGQFLPTTYLIYFYALSLLTHNINKTWVFETCDNMMMCINKLFTWWLWELLIWTNELGHITPYYNKSINQIQAMILLSNNRMFIIKVLVFSIMNSLYYHCEISNYSTQIILQWKGQITIATMINLV